MEIKDIVKTLIGYPNIEVLGFEIEKDKYHPSEEVFVANIVLMEEEQYRCPVCGQKCVKYDRSGNVKRWRSLDLSNKKFYIESVSPRCLCAEHGVISCKVPWAFPGSDYTLSFEARVAYSAAKMPTNLVSKLHRIKWGTVGNCVRRCQENLNNVDITARKPRKIAIDEVSYKKGYDYLMTVQDIETGEIIWAHDGFGDEVLGMFFEELTVEQRAGIEFVVADGARWITRQVEKYCPNAKRCVDPFHVVSWATEALDNTRKQLSNETKKNGSPS